MNKYIKLLILFLVCSLFMIIAYYSYEYLINNTNLKNDIQIEIQNQQNTTSSEAQKAIDFQFLNTNKETISFSDFLGKPIVINAWASWCGPCSAELPDFQKAYEKYSGDVEFLMINLTDGYTETYESTLQFIEDNNYTFPVYLDTLGQLSYSYQIYSIPRTLFINENGEIKADYTGMINETILENNISNILN